MGKDLWRGLVTHCRTDVAFASIEDVRAQAARIWERSADQHATMPPVGPAAIEERFLLGEWLACGAPTNADLGME